MCQSSDIPILVTVVTPCYNAERYIGATVVSVLAQTLPSWEMIVVDDGSTDGSAKAAEAAASSDARVRVVTKPNGGVASARNAGFAAAHPGSKYLYFLDADDVIEPTMLAEMVAYLDAHPTVGLVYTTPRLIGADGGDLGPADEASGWLPRRVPEGRFGMRPLRPEEPETPLEALFAVATIIPSVCVLRRSVYEQTPGWDESFGHLYEDLDLFLQMALRSQVHWLQTTLVRYRKHGAQSTADFDKLNRQEAKLWAKWRAQLPTLEPAHQTAVQKAFRFREECLVPLSGWQTGMRELRAGRLLPAAKFLGGAARRRAKALLPGRMDAATSAAVR